MRGSGNARGSGRTGKDALDSAGDDLEDGEDGHADALEDASDGRDDDAADSRQCFVPRQGSRQRTPWSDMKSVRGARKGR